MKIIQKALAAAGAALALAAVQPAAQAADQLTLQLPWVSQTPFAGYYVAAAKGFYDDVGLDVTVKAGGPDTSAIQVIVGGGADVIVDWLPTALASREKGVDLVNIGQVFKKSGLQLTCRADSGVKTPEDLKGKTVGIWYSGREFPFLAWAAKQGLKLDGTEDGVTVLKLGYNVDPLLQSQVACITTMSYNEYWQVLDGGLKPEDLVIFDFTEQGVSTLEDGLYVKGDRLADPAFVDQLGRFLAGTWAGWEYAAAHPDEAVEIVLAADDSGAQVEAHQARMFSQALKLVDLSSKGALDEADYERTVTVLLSGDSDSPVITKRPEGAWSPVASQAAAKLTN